MWWSCQSGSLRRFAYLLSISRPDAVWIPSGCCNQTRYDHLQAVCLQRSISADLGECLLCLGSWPSHFQWCLMAQLPMWWSCPSGFWRRFAYLPSISTLSARLILSVCCSLIRFVHLPTVYQQKSIFAGQAGFPLYPESLLLHFRLCLKAQPQGW